MKLHTAFSPGEIVHHRTFRRGRVVEVGSDSATIAFDYYGRRRVTTVHLAHTPFENEVGTALSLDIVTADTFAGRPTPAREFLDARNLFPMRNVTLVSGDGGTGKSLLITQLGAAVAGRALWLGREVRHGIVLYFSAEDDEAETHIRLSEICAAEGIDLAGLHELGIAVLAGKDAVLASEQARTATLQATPLWGALCDSVYSNSPILVVLDNLADVFAGNENSRPLARQFIGMLRGLAIQCNCAIVLLSHPSLTGINSGTGTSGNTAWSNSVRSRLYLRRDLADDGSEDDQAIRLLETKKSNYGPIGEQMRLRWEAGRFIALDEPRTETGDPIAQATKAERVFLHLLRWHLQRDKFVSPNKSVSYAPKVFACHPQAEGVKSRQFESAMTILLDQRRIEIYTHGSPSSRRQHIGFPFGTLPEGGDDE